MSAPREKVYVTSIAGAAIALPCSVCGKNERYEPMRAVMNDGYCHDESKQCIEYLRARLAAAEAERGELRQRVQQAEKAARTTVDDCRRQGVSVGRSLANYAATMERAAREKAERERDDARTALAAATEDTARLDWLEAHADYYGLRLIATANDAPFTVESIEHPIHGTGDTLRAAIDAVRAVATEKGS